MDAVILDIGQSIAAAIRDNPPGATFILNSGVHREGLLWPKDGQTFIGAPGAVLSGARVLEGWQREGAVWRRPGLPRPHPPGYGLLTAGRESGRHLEELFIDGVRLTRVDAQSDLGPGRWYFDANDGAALIAQDPTGRSVELSVLGVAFSGPARNLTIQDLTVEKFATPAQIGAIHGHEGIGWRILDCIVRWNHGQGINVGPGALVSGGAVIENGQLGIGGGGANGARIEGVDVARNNAAGYDPYWEAGGIKISASAAVIIARNHVHHNAGPGIWGDIDMIGTLYEANRVEENDLNGIMHEISQDAVIRCNVLVRNGRVGRDWLLPSQVLIQNSRNVQVERNYVEVGAGSGNGIVLIQEERGSGARGPRETRDNLVRGNIVVHRDAGGWNGFGTVADASAADLWPNRWEANIYYVPDEGPVHWMFGGVPRHWDELQGRKAFGGTVVQGERRLVGTTPAVKPPC